MQMRVSFGWLMWCVAIAAVASVSYHGGGRGEGDFRNLVDNFAESKAGSIPDSGQSTVYGG